MKKKRANGLSDQDLYEIEQLMASGPEPAQPMVEGDSDPQDPAPPAPPAQQPSPAQQPLGPIDELEQFEQSPRAGGPLSRDPRSAKEAQLRAEADRFHREQMSKMKFEGRDAIPTGPVGMRGNKAANELRAMGLGYQAPQTPEGDALKAHNNPMKSSGQPAPDSKGGSPYGAFLKSLGGSAVDAGKGAALAAANPVGSAIAYGAKRAGANLGGDPTPFNPMGIKGGSPTEIAKTAASGAGKLAGAIIPDEVESAYKDLFGSKGSSPPSTTAAPAIGAKPAQPPAAEQVPAGTDGYTITGTDLSEAWSPHDATAASPPSAPPGLQKGPVAPESLEGQDGAESEFPAPPRPPQSGGGPVGSISDPEGFKSQNAGRIKELQGFLGKIPELDLPKALFLFFTALNPKTDPQTMMEAINFTQDKMRRGEAKSELKDLQESDNKLEIEHLRRQREKEKIASSDNIKREGFASSERRVDQRESGATVRAALAETAKDTRGENRLTQQDRHFKEKLKADANYRNHLLDIAEDRLDEEVRRNGWSAKLESLSAKINMLRDLGKDEFSSATVKQRAIKETEDITEDLNRLFNELHPKKGPQ